MLFATNMKIHHEGRPSHHLMLCIIKVVANYTLIMLVCSLHLKTIIVVKLVCSLTCKVIKFLVIIPIVKAFLLSLLELVKMLDNVKWIRNGSNGNYCRLCCNKFLNHCCKHWCDMSRNFNNSCFPTIICINVISR